MFLVVTSFSKSKSPTFLVVTSLQNDQVLYDTRSFINLAEVCYLLGVAGPECSYLINFFRDVSTRICLSSTSSVCCVKTMLSSSLGLGGDIVVMLQFTCLIRLFMSFLLSGLIVSVKKKQRFYEEK